MKPVVNRDRDIAKDVAAVLTEFLARRIDGVVLAGRLRRIALIAERAPVLAAPGPTKADEHAQAFDQVFSYWAKRMGHPQAKPGPRRNKVLARLREGYSVAQLKRAIAGCAASPHHMGKNDRKQRYDDLTLICRDGAKVEWFIGIANEHVGAAADNTDDPLAAADERAAERALAEGRIDDYNAIQERMKQHAVAS